MAQPTDSTLKLDVHAEIIRVLRMEGDAILACADRLGAPAARDCLVKAVALLGGALERGGKIVVTGIGKSGKVGQKIAATLSSTGSLAVFLHPTEGLHGDLGIVTRADAVLALSYTGNTDELVRLTPALKTLGVPIIGLGGNAQSRLAGLCDVWIDAWVEQEACPHNLAPTTSTTLALAIGDALAIALMQLRGFDARAFAQNHPGGSLGNRLTLRVADVMHGGAAAATVSPNASMDEVVIEATRKKLGGVLVTQGDELLGLITDGDLRRSLQLRYRFFDLQAREVMTAKPVTVRVDQLAKEALELMENRSSQIGVLPVVDGDGKWRGLVRLHDLLGSF